MQGRLVDNMRMLKDMYSVLHGLASDYEGVPGQVHIIPCRVEEYTPGQTLNLTHLREPAAKSEVQDTGWLMSDQVTHTDPRPSWSYTTSPSRSRRLS